MDPSSVIRKTVVLEAHRMIEAAADDALRKLRTGLQSNAVSYPPGVTIPAIALDALARWKPEEGALEAIRALISDACANSMFQLFALLDGVADPEVRDAGEWFGADLTPLDDDEHREMLHDMFSETWWEFREETARS